MRAFEPDDVAGGEIDRRRPFAVEGPREFGGGAHDRAVELRHGMLAAGIVGEPAVGVGVACDANGEIRSFFGDGMPGVQFRFEFGIGVVQRLFRGAICFLYPLRPLSFLLRREWRVAAFLRPALELFVENAIEVRVRALAIKTSLNAVCQLVAVGVQFFRFRFGHGLIIGPFRFVVFVGRLHEAEETFSERGGEAGLCQAALGDGFAVCWGVKAVFRSLPVALTLLLAGCSGAYYGAMEKFGIAKRDILADRVEETREAQNEAKEQFADALQRFLAVTKTSGGDLQAKYEQLDDEFKDSEARAKEVRERIAAVEDVAEALFREWKQELGQYSSASLRRDSERQLEQTRRRYDALIALMRRAEQRMEPVLNTFRDQVLFLKHNLNARALAQLDETNRTLEADISRLVADMEASIREAENFIRDLRAQP